jgi:hypothetical protein
MLVKEKDHDVFHNDVGSGHNAAPGSSLLKVGFCLHIQIKCSGRSSARPERT